MSNTINISELINAKLDQMDASKTIETTIQAAIEREVVKAIDSAINGYEIRRDLEKLVSEQVSLVVKQIGFTAYNSFIAEKIKQITEGAVREDIAEKIQQRFNEILVVKRDSIKLSEICNAYRDYICGEVDEQEKYNLEQFYVSVEEREPPYNWIEFKFAKTKPERRLSDGENSVYFTVHRNREKVRGDGLNKTGTIGFVRIDGYDISKSINFYGMSSIEQLLINIAYNRTPVIIDVESEDDVDNSYDVDC